MFFHLFIISVLNLVCFLSVHYKQTNMEGRKKGENPGKAPSLKHLLNRFSRDVAQGRSPGVPHTTFPWSFVFMCSASHLLLLCVITQTPASQTAVHSSPCSLHFKRLRILQTGTLSSCQALRRSPAHLGQMIKVRYQKKKPFLKVLHK